MYMFNVGFVTCLLNAVLFIKLLILLDDNSLTCGGGRWYCVRKEAQGLGCYKSQDTFWSTL